MQTLRTNKSRQVTIRRQKNCIIAGGNFSALLKEQRALQGVSSHRILGEDNAL